MQGPAVDLSNCSGAGFLQALKSCPFVLHEGPTLQLCNQISHVVLPSDSQWSLTSLLIAVLALNISTFILNFLCENFDWLTEQNVFKRWEIQLEAVRMVTYYRTSTEEHDIPTLEHPTQVDIDLYDLTQEQCWSTQEPKKFCTVRK